MVQVLSTGVVTSPNYPSCNYPNNLNTTETISVKEGMVAVLEFTAFNTSYSDKLTIRDGDGTTLMEERSGECLPGKIWSKTNAAHLQFYTDSNLLSCGNHQAQSCAECPQVIYNKPTKLRRCASRVHFEKYRWPIISSVPDTAAPHFGIHRPKK